jgi:hypothetical protein
MKLLDNLIFSFIFSTLYAALLYVIEVFYGIQKWFDTVGVAICFAGVFLGCSFYDWVNYKRNQVERKEP